MHATIVKVFVKSEHIAEFIEASKNNHENSIKEPGNLRFDILQHPDETDCFILYEAYKTESHALAHKQTPHYLAWRETVAEMMAKPREGISYNGLFPA